MIDVAALRARYIAEVTDGIDNGYALPIEAAEAILAELRRGEEQGRPYRRIADLGAGFSTVLFHRWLLDRNQDWCKYEVDSFDHDLAWLGRIYYHAGLHLDPSDTKHWTWHGVREYVPHLSAWDLILVDHGPAMADRVADMPLIASKLTYGGLLVLDDWRKQYKNDAARVLTGLGFTLEPVAGTRLCFARRRGEG